MRAKKPYVTITLIVINVLIFLWMDLFAGGTMDSDVMLAYGGLDPNRVLMQNETWRLFTAMFLHFDIEHLIGNMVLLGAAGPILERALGPVYFLGLYIISGLDSSGLSFWHMVSNGEYNALAAGASGAIFGVVGALIWIVIRHRGQYQDLTMRGMIFVLALSAYTGLTGGNVDNWGHLGGLVTGFILGMITYRPDYR